MIVIKEGNRHSPDFKWWVGIKIGCIGCWSDLVLEESDIPIPDGQCTFGIISKFICPVCGNAIRRITGT